MNLALISNLLELAGSAIILIAPVVLGALLFIDPAKGKSRIDD
jgi:hypothetical protein